MTQATQQTPASLGFHMPAEWEPHSAVWLAWPYDETTFPNRIQAAESVFVKMIKAIHESETVKLLVLDEAMQKRAVELLQKAGVGTNKVEFVVTKFADVWIRDYGPTFLVNTSEKSMGWVQWNYNGYGKGDVPYFTPVLIDNEIFNNLVLPGKKFQPGIVMEGGSIEVNGKGTLIATEQCLLNPNRNSQLTKPQIEQYLKDYLGVSNIIWLKRGLFNDHTDGHIDDIAKFVAPSKILAAYEDDEKDENFKILHENYSVLSDARDQDGNAFEVIKLPMPHMRYEPGHSIHSENPNENVAASGALEKAAVSYMNFYIGNTAVLVPTFEDENDTKALKIIHSCFPERKVVGINCREIIYGGGSIHCITQQQPLV